MTISSCETCINLRPGIFKCQVLCSLALADAYEPASTSKRGAMASSSVGATNCSSNRDCMFSVSMPWH